MNYTELKESYKYDVLAEAIYAREVEFFHYDFDRKNFEHLLIDLPEGEYRSSLEQRLKDTIQQMASVDAIHAALMAQIDNPDAYAEAAGRAMQKREEAKNEVRPSSK